MSIELTPELAPEFAVTVRGYDRAQVDEYIDWLREWLSNATVRMESAEADSGQLREQLRRLQLRVEELEVETSDQPPRTIGALGDRMTRILALAEEGAATVRADAEAEAERVRAEARAEAEALVRTTQEQQAELDGRLASANEQADRTVHDAETRAAETTALLMLAAESRAKATEADAEQRARELVDRAQQERARILEQLTTEKGALDAHLEGLMARRTEVLAGLSQLHEALGTTIAEVAPVPLADGQALPPQEAEASIAPAGIDDTDLRPGDDQDTDVTASNELPDPAGAAGAQDAGQPPEAVGAGSPHGENENR